MVKNRFILLFLDGLGLGPPGPHNPLGATGTMPRCQTLWGQPLVAGAYSQRPRQLLKPIDANLGVPGLTQSATGQTTLYPANHDSRSALSNAVRI